MDNRMARLASSIAPTIRSANSSVVSTGFSFMVVMGKTLGASNEFNGPFRQAHPVAVDDLPRRLAGGAGCSERNEQGREVLDGRVGVRHARGPVAEVDERVNVAGGEPLVGPRV